LQRLICVIASGAKQSISLRRAMDCFAPLAMTALQLAARMSEATSGLRAEHDFTIPTRDPRSSNAQRALPSKREPAAIPEIIGYQKSPGTEERAP
jgi:hypothetical protein